VIASVLVHACCAHCTAYTVGHWRDQGYIVTALWYNPNIHPFTEHNLRVEAMKTLSHTMKLPLVVIEGYDFKEYFHRIVGQEDRRCGCCFELRLGRVAKLAKEMGIDAFTSSLLISPDQKHDQIKQIGEKVAVENELTFLYADLRKRYSDSRHITKPMELYRQQYCGCIYSEYERYTEKDRVIRNNLNPLPAPQSP
jgi:predicted adenine nucleotide alpha hydrolase (AANH) superfamily ATPase